jgi:hypothetical protein
VSAQTEFLLARIYDDECLARTAFADHNGNGPDWSEQWSGAVEMGGDEHELLLCNDSGVSRHIENFDPARVLRECAAKRALITDLTSERHEVVEDCWYTCAAATEERDGGTCCNDSRGEDCDCGRDNRVARRLGTLAAVYADHPDYHAAQEKG